MKLEGCLIKTSLIKVLFSLGCPSFHIILGQYQIPLLCIKIRFIGSFLRQIQLKKCHQSTHKPANSIIWIHNHTLRPVNPHHLKACLKKRN